MFAGKREQSVHQPGAHASALEQLSPTLIQSCDAITASPFRELQEPGGLDDKPHFRPRTFIRNMPNEVSNSIRKPLRAVEHTKAIVLSQQVLLFINYDHRFTLDASLNRTLVTTI